MEHWALLSTQVLKGIRMHVSEISANSDAVGVVGGGTMGIGIAYVFAVAGWRTIVVEPNDDQAGELGRTISATIGQGIARGKLTAAQGAVVESLVSRVSSVDELDAGLALVIETVPERFELKATVIARIEERAPRIIATNTSALSVDRLAANLENPASFIGMHFFNPVWSLPMVELVLGSATTDETAERARLVAASIGKQTITVSDTPGFATSRLDLIASLEAMRMLQDGVATAEDIDRAMVIAYRHPIGPLELSDIVGLDVRLDIAENLATSLGPRYEPPQVLRDLVAAGNLGRKTGSGFFEWRSTDSGTTTPSPDLHRHPLGTP